MHLTALSIRNFRNFQAVDIPLSSNLVLLGENRVGKTNLLFAIRLVFDQALPDAARQLKLSDFWDGCDLASSPKIEVHVDFTGFDTDDALVALLTDFRLAADHATARLSYVFRKKPEIVGAPTSSDDYEFIIFGGGEEARTVPSRVRRRIALDMLDALRDAEGQLASWRSSPLRPLLEDATGKISREDLGAVASDLQAAASKLEALGPVGALESALRSQLVELSGPAQDLNGRLRFAPADPLRLFRSIGLFIDDGKRTIGEASLGSANVALIALKLAEFTWRRAKNERNYSLLCIEEPEAHLHPHLQRAVFQKLFKDPEPNQALLVTTHSQVLAAVAPLRSLVVLRHQSGGTSAHSLARLPVTPSELDDVERYLTATRSELLFSRGVIFVEGDAEEALVPVFAEALGKNLNQLGITICNVAGVNFTPYVKLAASLGMPWAVITDWDPLDGSKPALGRARALGIWDAHCQASGVVELTPEEQENWRQVDFASFSAAWASAGIFLNEHTFEISVAGSPGLLPVLLDVLDEQGFGPVRTARIEAWRGGEQVDPSQLLAMVADIGKGRLASILARKLTAPPVPPAYIASAIQFVASRV